MVEVIIGTLGSLLGKIIDRLPFGRRNTIPRHTLRLVLKPHGAWWGMGTMGANNQPAMQVACDWIATNITTEQVIITTAFIGKSKTEAISPLVKHSTGNVYGAYPVLPKDTTYVSLNFWIQPPICSPERSFRADVTVVDQFGNRHKIRQVEFKWR